MSEPEPLNAYFLDVGQGDCTVILPPGDDTRAVLCDCADQYVAERFLAHHPSIRALRVVVSHLDLDHIAGLLDVLKRFIWQGGLVERFHIGTDRPIDEFTKAARELLGWWLRQSEGDPDATGMPFRATEPTEVLAGPDWSIRIILPFYRDRLAKEIVGGEEPNLFSAALRIEYGAAALLVGGDAPLRSWERLAKWPELLRAQAFRVPHHAGAIDEGQPSWDMPRLYREVAPEAAIVSVGTHNRHGHPLPEHTAAIQAVGCGRLFCTQLTPRCHPRPADLRANAVARATMMYPYRHHLRQRRKEVPCAGTILAQLYPGGAVVIDPPMQSEFDQFIAGTAHPLCRSYGS